MAYNKQDLINQSIEAIKENELCHISHVVAFLPCSHQTFYTKNLDKHESIKEALESNRIRKKIALRKKWENSDATREIALYKLLGNEDELDRLNNNDNKKKDDSESNEQKVVKIIFGNEERQREDLT